MYLAYSISWLLKPESLVLAMLLFVQGDLWSIIGDSGFVVSSVVSSASASFSFHILTGKMGTRPVARLRRKRGGRNTGLALRELRVRCPRSTPLYAPSICTSESCRPCNGCTATIRAKQATGLPDK
jgi:hypothetical protein